MTADYDVHREIRQLSAYLREGETVQRLASGIYGAGPGLLAVTDYRVLLLRDGRSGQASEGFPLGRLSSAEWVADGSRATITVSDSASTASLRQAPMPDAQDIVSLVRALAGEALHGGAESFLGPHTLGADQSHPGFEGFEDFDGFDDGLGGESQPYGSEPASTKRPSTAPGHASSPAARESDLGTAGIERTNDKLGTPGADLGAAEDDPNLSGDEPGMAEVGTGAGGLESATAALRPSDYRRSSGTGGLRHSGANGRSEGSAGSHAGSHAEATVALRTNGHHRAGTRAVAEHPRGRAAAGIEAEGLGTTTRLAPSESPESSAPERNPMQDTAYWVNSYAPPRSFRNSPGTHPALVPSSGTLPGAMPVNTIASTSAIPTQKQNLDQQQRSAEGDTPPAQLAGMVGEVPISALAEDEAQAGYLDHETEEPAALTRPKGRPQRATEDDVQDDESEMDAVDAAGLTAEGTKRPKPISWQAPGSDARGRGRGERGGEKGNRGGETGKRAGRGGSEQEGQHKAPSKPFTGVVPPAPARPKRSKKWVWLGAGAAGLIGLAAIGSAKLVTPNSHNEAAPVSPTPAAAVDSPLGPMVSVTKIVAADRVEVSGPLTGMVVLLGIVSPAGNSCGATEAKQFATDKLANKSVTLVTDPSQPVTDKAGHRLAYLQLGDGTDYSSDIVGAGMAKYYEGTRPVHNAAAIKDAQTRAKTDKAGLWAPPCNGKFAAAAGTSDSSTSSGGSANSGGSTAAESTGSTGASGSTGTSGSSTSSTRSKTTTSPRTTREVSETSGTSGE
jgi:micrococcal nuclease